MKTLLLLGFLTLLTLGRVWAQDTTIHGRDIRLHHADPIYTAKYLAFYEGKLYYHFSGKGESIVDTTYYLPNGTEVHPDGMYRGKDGLVYSLRNGEYLDMEGNRYTSIFNFNTGKKMTRRELERAEVREW